MDNNGLNRTREVVLKCQEGSSVRPSTNDQNTDKNKKSKLQQYFGQVKQVMSSQEGGQYLDMINQTLFGGNSAVNNQSNLTQGINSAYDTAADVVSQINPLAGTVMKAGSFASNALTAAGIGTDQQTTTDKIMDSTLGKLSGLGIVNAIGGKEADDFSVDQSTVERVGGSYGGTVSEVQKAAEKAGKKYGLFSSGSRKKANRIIAEARNKQNIMTNIANEASDQSEMVAAMGDIYDNAYAYQLQGGYDQRYMRAKEGGKLPQSRFEPEIVELDLEGGKLPQSRFEPEIVELDLEVDKIVPGMLAEGGVIDEVINPTTGQIEQWQPEIIGTPQSGLVETHKRGGRVEKALDAPEIEETDQKNLIPEGALHKNKHHMDNADELTKKGIPVVDNERNQQAEIECNEIIFTKEVTTKLEELYDVYYSDKSTQKEKDAAAVDAGKLLTKEIMLNTDDRTGLIDTLQNGGTIGQKKPAYNDWLNTINPDFLDDNYDLETAYNVLPFDQLEKWRNETLKDNPSESEDWHLPSVQQIDDNTIMFLKKGKTTKDNPELKGEFKFYKTDPEFSREWKMTFNKDENRWYYVRRQGKK